MLLQSFAINQRQTKNSACAAVKLIDLAVYNLSFIFIRPCLRHIHTVPGFTFTLVFTFCSQINTTKVQDIDLSRFVPQEVDNTGITVASMDRFTSRNKTQLTETCNGKKILLQRRFLPPWPANIYHQYSVLMQSKDELKRGSKWVILIANKTWLNYRGGAAERSLWRHRGQRFVWSRGRRGGRRRGGWRRGSGGWEPLHGRRSGGAWWRTQHTGAGGLSQRVRWKLGRTKWQKDGLMDAWR